MLSNTNTRGSERVDTSAWAVKAASEAAAIEDRMEIRPSVPPCCRARQQGRQSQLSWGSAVSGNGEASPRK